MASLADRRRIVDTVFGAMAAEVLFAAARLGVADLIGESESAAVELAAQYNADSTSFTRLLRTMASMGLLTEPSPGRFRLTESGGLLRSDRADSLRAFVRMFGDPAMLAAWRELETAVRTGQTTFDKLYGTSFFDYLAQRPELSAQFNAAMRQTTVAAAQQLPDSYDFNRFHTVVDIGGGDGTLLAAVLKANPALQGILFDTAEGLAQSDETFVAAAVGDRATRVVGDFFHSAPPGADLYLLKSVIHDWDDERCATILGHVRRVIPGDGRLLIIEFVLSPVVDGAMPLMTYLNDLNMLVNVGGRERTREEFQHLCATTGFRLGSVTPLSPPFSLLEAFPVG
ncbi:MAG: methyltransferase [Mycobacterium sp.]|uniref:methyltransferase n=1 Tax=Mycobacterium sp. TaxID=1785 RepID=UPI003CC59BD4